MTAVGLLYDDDGFVEDGGLYGRRVAGREFLDALFAHGTWDRMSAVVRTAASADTLTRYFQQRTAGGRRELRLVPDAAFLDSFHPDPPARLLFTPCPPDLRYGWARRHRGGDGYALCGVTHTLCSKPAFDWLGQLLVGPFAEYDALVCTSAAVRRMVRAATDWYADHLREAVGGDPRVRLRLETIPLGVDPVRFHPPSPGEQAVSRDALGVSPDEVCVLFVGRLSHHTKAHPFPLFAGCAAAAGRTGRAVHLVLAGWAANDAVLAAFRDGAAAFAPGVRVTFADGTDPGVRQVMWHAADVFASLSDNVQETFGLVVVEALASGLPVVASDWDGYRDLVTDGETGLLVPTRMVHGATADSLPRLVLEAHPYEHFLAETSQAVAVDVPAAADALTRLVGDAAERRRLGANARRAALERFTWAEVVRRYEELWAEQEVVRAEVERTRPAGPGPRPGLYPPVDVAFAGYPSGWLADDAVLFAAPDAADRLLRVLAAPLATHAGWNRGGDPAAVLAAADGRPLVELASVAGGGPAGRATVAWLLKYDLLRVTAPAPPPPAP